MIRKTLTAAALIAALAAPAFATPIGQGATQLAESLGVEPGLYSLAQLGELAAARSDESSAAHQRVAFILANPEGPGAGDMAFVSRAANDLDVQAAFPDAFLTGEPNRLAD